MLDTMRTMLLAATVAVAFAAGGVPAAAEKPVDAFDADPAVASPGDDCGSQDGDNFGGDTSDDCDGSADGGDGGGDTDDGYPVGGSPQPVEPPECAIYYGIPTC
jgi:phage repressor protein C with HTH and peptisase S24 domain